MLQTDMQLIKLSWLSMVWPYWFHQCLFNIPSMFEALIKGCGTNAKYLKPFCEACRFVSYCHAMIMASIARLFGPGSPIAIVRSVSKVVIAPLKRMVLAWPCSHVGIESRKIHPPFADRNTSAAVAMEAKALGVRASLPHRVPDIMLGNASHPMGQKLFATLFCAQAPATEGSARKQIRSNDGADGSTSALAQPLRKIALGSSKFQDKPTLKSLASKIFGGSHDASLQAKVSGPGSLRVRPQRLRLARQPDQVTLA
jgi:hypothetical protein